MLNTSLRGVTSRGIGQWRRRAPTMECGAYANANTRVPYVTDTNAARDRSTRTRVANWGARTRRHVITVHDNILKHLLSKCIPSDHNVYITWDALAYTPIIFYLLSKLCMPQYCKINIQVGKKLVGTYPFNLFTIPLYVPTHSCMGTARIPKHM